MPVSSEKIFASIINDPNLMIKSASKPTAKETQLLQPDFYFSGLTRLVLTNALYFKADHPFIFLIQDNPNSDILLGRVSDPSQDRTDTN